ncbi:hypothetical protein [Chitinophaga rupis]|uniref:hypothetical protein n=1 Tax=Chitinophaga rupis TaxID=573321 RepID=UPI00139003B3|nr:hypothetical protein [Chitinophaga rupis]
MSAIIGFVAAFQGGYWLLRESVAAFFGWMFLILGLIAFVRCTWFAIKNSLVMELNHEGIMYKKYCYAWNTLRSYGIRKEVGESGSFNYLILYFNNGGAPLEIQLDWMDNNESIPEQMAVYAKAFQVEFDGVVKKEV